MGRKIFVFLLLFFVLLISASFSSRLIAKLDFVDAAVLDVVETLAQQAGLDLVISGNASLAQNKRTSVHLKNVTPEKAIDYILKTNGLSYEKRGKAILVSMFSQAQTTDLQRGEIEAVNLRYLSAKRVSSLLAKVLPALKTSVGARANSLVLRGKRPLIEEAKALVFSIDEPVPQVLIESKVLEISESDSMRLGVTYGNQSGGFSFVTDKDTARTTPYEDLRTTLNNLISTGKANVVATPKIATLDNHEAVVNIGKRIPYAVPVSSGSNSTQWSVEYIDAGVKLKITPHIGEEGNITTSIQPEVSSISEWRTTAAGEFPVISTRNVQATLRVKDGETIVVGGLLSESDRENISRLPILGYLPLVGMLFQNKTTEKAKTEIVFLITPHLI